MRKYFITFEIVRTKISGNCVIGFKEIEDKSDIQEMCEKIKYGEHSNTMADFTL